MNDLDQKRKLKMSQPCSQELPRKITVKLKYTFESSGQRTVCKHIFPYLDAPSIQLMAKIYPIS